MGKDYKIGLLSGLVLAVVGLIWVATRPSLSTEARILRPARAASRSNAARPPVGPVTDRGLFTPPAAGSSQPSGGPVIPPGRLQPEPADASKPTQQATVSERVPSQEIPDRQPTAPDLTIYERSEKIKTTRFHIVRKDETLSAISQQYYGSPNKWRKILDANEDTVKDANKIRPGVKLIIPD